MPPTCDGCHFSVTSGEMSDVGVTAILLPPKKTEAQLPDNNKSQTPGRCWCKRKGFIQVLHNLGEWWTQRPSYLPAQAPSSYRDREGRASPHPIQLSCYLAC